MPATSHHTAGHDLPWARRLTKARRLVGRRPQLPGRLADALQGDRLGLLISGFVAQIDPEIFNSIFLSGSPPLVRTVWGR